MELTLAETFLFTLMVTTVLFFSYHLVVTCMSVCCANRRRQLQPIAPVNPVVPPVYPTVPPVYPTVPPVYPTVPPVYPTVARRQVNFGSFHPQAQISQVDPDGKVRMADSSNEEKVAVRIFFTQYPSDLVDLNTTDAAWEINWSDGPDSFHFEVVPEGRFDGRQTVQRNMGRWVKISAPRL